MIIQPGSEKRWAEESCLFGLSSVERWSGKKLFIWPESGNSCLSGLRLSKVKYQTWVSKKKRMGFVIFIIIIHIFVGMKTQEMLSVNKKLEI